MSFLVMCVGMVAAFGLLMLLGALERRYATVFKAIGAHIVKQDSNPWFYATIVLALFFSGWISK